MTPTSVGTVGLYASAVISTVGLATFCLSARFWRSRGGWHVFWYMLVISWVLDLSSISHLVADPAWFAWLRAATFTIGMPFVLAWRSWIIFDLQLRRRTETYRGDRQAG